MKKSFVFISCGQFTDEEKLLGVALAKMTRDITGLDAFFAEQVQDLNGLDDNILNALHNAAALIVVMHPRGKITRPDGSTLVRASVWIEQEIAIATYIQRVERRKLPVLAFVHSSVDREGLRQLIHLNPIQFDSDAEILEAMPDHVRSWGALTSPGIRLELCSAGQAQEQGHQVRHLEVVIHNDGNTRIDQFNGEVQIPAGLLKHWNTMYAGEVTSADTRSRRFRFDEAGRGPIPPHDSKVVYRLTLCPKCAADDTKGHPQIAAALVAESVIEATVWLDGKELVDSKTITELARR